jgi:putrescine transport system ATP-binding protein
MAPFESPVSMMFQSYALFPHMTVWDNVAFGPRRAGLPKGQVQARVDDMLKLVQLQALSQRKPHQLSGGQQQRVALARSLARQPQLLLLDEPLGALDKKLREQTQIELVNIIQSVGVTCVMVTHDQQEAMAMATRIAVMSEGRLMQVGTPHEIYETPANRFVADFIGHVNLMEGRVVATEPVRVHCTDCLLHFDCDRADNLSTDMAVALRPEKIRLSRVPPAAAQALGQPRLDGLPPDEAVNQVRGRVQERAYLGSHTLYHLRLPSGALLKVSVSSAEPALAHGDEAWASWPPSAPVMLSA